MGSSTVQDSCGTSKPFRKKNSKKNWKGSLEKRLLSGKQLLCFWWMNNLTKDFQKHKDTGDFWFSRDYKTWSGYLKQTTKIILLLKDSFSTLRKLMKPNFVWKKSFFNKSKTVVKVSKNSVLWDMKKYFLKFCSAYSNANLSFPKKYRGKVSI